MLELLLGILFQHQIDLVRVSELSETALRGEAKVQAESANKRAVEEKRSFEGKYESLGYAMDQFTKAYNRGRGKVWPKKEAEALARAIRELEDTATWRPLSRSFRYCFPQNNNRCAVPIQIGE